jgi:hypothetical protein
MSTRSPWGLYKAAVDVLVTVLCFFSFTEFLLIIVPSALFRVNTLAAKIFLGTSTLGGYNNSQARGQIHIDSCLKMKEFPRCSRIDVPRLTPYQRADAQGDLD